MLNLKKAVRQLRKERDQALSKVKQLDIALKALGSLGTFGRDGGRLQTGAKGRRSMSVAARKRIAAAQRARWAKWKAAKGNK